MQSINDNGRNRRRSPRIRTFKAGKLVFNAGASVLDCTIRDLSSSGACLDVGAPARTPAEFVLEFDLGEGIRRVFCATKWRRKGAIGVIFRA